MSTTTISTHPITALLIDDEPLARLIVREYLQSYPNITVLQECNDGFEGLKAIQQFHPDLIFLDIQMPKINGFEMPCAWSKTFSAVIFTTAFDEYAIRAFETHAVDYLLKPFSKERFDKAIRKWLDQHEPESAPSSTAGSPTTPTTQSLLDAAAESPAQQQRVVVKTGRKK